MFWVDGVRYDLNVGRILIRLVNSQHITLHNGANRRAGCEKEISYINIMMQVFAAYTVAVLVYKLKSGDALVNRIRYLLPVHCFGNSLPVSINRQCFFTV